jgi:tetratricopeptide (TPR) repeat protein
LGIFRGIGDREGEATGLGNIGNIYFAQRRREDALNAHQDSLKISQQIADREGQAISFTNMGTIYFDEGKTPKAREMFHQARDIYKTPGAGAELELQYIEEMLQRLNRP